MELNIIQQFITRNECYIANVEAWDYRYRDFQQHGPSGLMLHSVGCAQPSAEVFATRWNSPAYEVAVHAFIDANHDGEVRKIMPWNFRAWHCGGSANNTHLGIEMCESSHIRYLKEGEPGYSVGKFVILDRTKAVADAMRAYHTAVKLFAMLCKMWSLDPLTDICSHREGWYMGIASGHQDPEWYWNGLGINYTMDGFRAAVKTEMEDVLSDMTEARFYEILNEKLNEQRAEFERRVQAKIDALEESYEALCDELRANIGSDMDKAMDKRLGKQIVHIQDIPGGNSNNGIRAKMRYLLDEGFINGGTAASVDNEDLRLPWGMVRMMAVMMDYTQAQLRSLLTDEAPEDEGGECDGDDLNSCCPIVFPEDGTAVAAEE